MKLLYIWIEQFRNIKNQGFVIDNEYTVEIENPNESIVQYYGDDGIRIYFSGDSLSFGRKIYQRSIIIHHNDKYIRNTHTDPIDNVAVLVGENATGKSSILEGLNSRSDQFTYRNEDNRYCFFVFLNEQDNSIVIRTRDIWLTSYENIKSDHRHTSGYEEYIITLNNQSTNMFLKRDITHLFSFSLKKDIGIYNGYSVMGMGTVHANLGAFTFRNSFEGVYDFLCDFKEFGGTGNKFVFYLEDKETERSGVPYFCDEKSTAYDRKYCLIHKLSHLLFENLRTYLLSV